MNIYKPIKYLAVLLAGLFGFSNLALADGTASGTSIQNTANISYTVGGGSPINDSAAVSFDVDEVINFTVTAVNASVNVSPGQSQQVLAFDLTHFGNSTLDFLLTDIDIAPDDFAATGLQVLVDDGDNVFDAGDTATFIDELPPTVIAGGTTIRVYIVGNIPAGATNGQIDAFSLVAQAVSGGAAGIGTPIIQDDNNNASPGGTFRNPATGLRDFPVAAGVAVLNPDTAGVEIVFNDAAGTVDATGAADIAANAQASDDSQYLVGAPTINVTKTVTVISDGLGNVAPNAKAIPGATVEYVIRVENTGVPAIDADAVTLGDDVSTLPVTSITNAYNAEASCVAPDCGVLRIDDPAGAATRTAYSSAVDADAGSLAADVLAAAVGTLTSTQVVEIRFQVTID